MAKKKSRGCKSTKARKSCGKNKSVFSELGDDIITKSPSKGRGGFSF